VTVNFKRIGLKDSDTTRFQSNVEQSFQELDSVLDSLPTILYGSFVTDFTTGLVSQDTSGFTIAYDRDVDGQTGNVPDINLVLTLDRGYSKFLFCSALLTGATYEGSGEPIDIHYVSDNISSGGRLVNLATVGVQSTRLLENGRHFLEITLLK